MPTLFRFSCTTDAIEHSHDDAFAEHGGQNADAHIDRMAADVQLDTAVLRQPTFGDI